MTSTIYKSDPTFRSGDSTSDLITQNRVLAKKVIDHMRIRGFKVSTTYDISGRTQILSSIIPITQAYIESSQDWRMKFKFIAIEIGVAPSIIQPKQLLYIKQIERSGGVYLFVSSLTKFYQNFDLIIQRAYYE